EPLRDRGDRTPHEIVKRRRPAAVGHMHQLGAGLFHEQLDREIVERGGASRAEGELARPRLGVVDELLDRIYWRLGIDDHGGLVFWGGGGWVKGAATGGGGGDLPCVGEKRIAPGGGPPRVGVARRLCAPAA